MRRLIQLLGVCVLLLAVQIDAKEKNSRNFWDLWGSDQENTAPAAASDDFILEDGGSGMDTSDNMNTHGDDEDFDVDVGSGDDKIPTNKSDSHSHGVDDKTSNHGNVDEEDDDDYDVYDEEKKKGPSDDEDLFDGSGGSGDYPVVEETIVPIGVLPVEVTMSPTAAPQPKSPCQNLRNSALSVAQFVPECNGDGSFKKQQCTVDRKEKYCWCVNPNGVEISGTRLKDPPTPDACDFGTDLTTCVFQLVQHSQGMLGTYKPKCTLEGQYESVQCQGSECWCVDENGNEMLGSFKTKPELPDCAPKTTMAPKETEKPKVPVAVIPDSNGGYTVKNPDPKKDEDSNVIVNTINTGGKDNKDETEKEEEETNKINDDSHLFAPAEQLREPILAQPGLLAAIIGGAVVGLLCMVLLVMFIVYRMRKKDEGSYPLDEQKYQNYSYAKAPDKEFYA